MENVVSRFVSRPGRLRTASDVVREDLHYICDRASTELEALSGAALLITGGAGFLGYYLVQTILRWNAGQEASRRIRLTVHDNYVRGVPEWLAAYAAEADLKIVRRDVTTALPADAGQFSHLIHAASIASPSYYREHPIETMDANVIGLRHLLEHSRRQQLSGSPVQGFLFFSTSEIYGDPTPDNIPTPETYRGNVSCTGPRACYDESKRFGETLCVTFVRQFDLPITIARPFNNYGPGLRITDRRVIPDFSRDIFAERDVVMLSDGSASRTFCYVADAVVGYYKLLVRGRPGEAYNIGTDGPEVSIRELAERTTSLAREMFGYTGRVVCGRSGDRDYLTDNPSRRRPVIDKARHELEFEPSIALDEGLRRSLLWYQAHREDRTGSRQ